MKRTVLTTFIGAFIFLSVSSACSAEDYVKWLINKSGVLSPGDHPLVSDVRDIFDRVLDAADKRANRLPRLVIIRKPVDPWVICLKDGTVVLTRKGMETCYKNVDKETGNARVAFILGHELAHLANDDFWDIEVFEAVQKFGPGSKPVQEIIKPGNDDERKKKELHADAYGLLYASMAGYSLKAIVDTQGKNFFREWADQATGKAAFAKTHPDPGDRALFLLSNAESVKNDLVLFDLGVLLCQLGMYKDALDFLETFQRKFPCREVFNNIGFAHFQVAMKTLARYDSDRAYKYRLSTILDTETRARTFRTESLEDIFKTGMRKAIRNFRYACEKDRFYVPGLVNLSSALVMTGSYYEAMKVLDDALKIKKDDPWVMNNQAVAMYLLGISFNADKSEQALGILNNVAKTNPGFSHAFFNMARILAECRGDTAAGKAWDKCLEIEPVGVFADIARKAAGIKHVPGNQEKLQQIFSQDPPVRPGSFDGKAKKLVAEIPKKSFVLDNISGEYYAGKDFRVLVLESEVEVVEAPVRNKI